MFEREETTSDVIFATSDVIFATSDFVPAISDVVFAKSRTVLLSLFIKGVCPRKTAADCGGGAPAEEDARTGMRGSGRGDGGKRDGAGKREKNTAGGGEQRGGIKKRARRISRTAGPE